MQILMLPYLDPQWVAQGYSQWAEQGFSNVPHIAKYPFHALRNEPAIANTISQRMAHYAMHETFAIGDFTMDGRRSAHC